MNLKATKQILMVLMFLHSLNVFSKMDRLHSESFLGEKRLDSYSERWQPLIYQDLYQGKMYFTDDLYFQNFFQPYLFNRESEINSFLKSELNEGMSCSNELLSGHFDEIRYSYRLITLSYLLEGQWHLNMLSKHLAMKNGCSFDFDKFLKQCRPQSSEMKKFISLISKYRPKYEESLPKNYLKSDWWKDYSKRDFKYYSHYRFDDSCKGKCELEGFEKKLNNVCEQDERLMNLICSEMDEIYGLSNTPDAYHLIGLSNIINTYNKQGEALACLRRFSVVMRHKEVKYPVFQHLFKTLRAHLGRQYQERFLQGRVFFYGSGKEFEEKGLKNLYVMEQPLKIAELNSEEDAPAPSPSVVKTPEKKPLPAIVKRPSTPVKKEVVEITEKQKSAFLQAAELRQAQSLDQVEVDMLKLKYDYVFSLGMLTKLSERLKGFMTREALKEMMKFDKLGTQAAPVPLLFIKFMIDLEEHTGLYNIITVLGEDFYVSNEIDSSFKPVPERIRLVNSESTNRQWQIYVIKP